jgi:hypothetical protein
MSNNRLMRWALALGCTAVATAALAQEMPKPGPEHEKLGYFAGKWEFEGESKEGPMGPGGAIAFTETCELFEGDFAVVCESEGTSPMGPTKTFSIMTYDTEKEAYLYHAVQNDMPAFSAIGKREAKTWHWKTETQMDAETMYTRVTITETSATSYTFKVEMSTDDTNWMTAVEGTSTKTTS